MAIIIIFKFPYNELFQGNPPLLRLVTRGNWRNGRTLSMAAGINNTLVTGVQIGNNVFCFNS